MMSARWTMALLGLAMVTRVGAAIAIGGSFHFADEALYVDAAHRLINGDGFGSGYSSAPGYPVFLALLSLGIPVSPVVLRVLQAIVAALGGVFVFSLAERWFGARAAVLAAFAYALDPLLVITSGLLYPETLAAVLLTGIVLLTLDAAERDGVARSLSIGALLAILAMLRPVALVLPPVIAVWLALALPGPASRRMVHAAMMGLAWVLVLSPWLARNYQLHHELIPMTTPGAHTAPVRREEAARRGLVLSMAQWAWNHPEALAARVARQFAQFWELTPSRMVTDDPARREALHQRDPRLETRPLFSRSARDLVSAGSFSLELLLALVGITAVARTHWRQALLLLGVILAYAAGYALFVAKLRYRIPILPLLFVFTGAGAAAVYSLARRAAARHH